MKNDRQGRPRRAIFLLSCVKGKRPLRAKAVDLYDSALFRKMLRYSQRHNPDAVFILSAKYGLLDPEDIIDPYELTLKTMPIGEVKAWAVGVAKQLRQRADLERDDFTILASDRYRRYLLPHLHHYSVPMKGLRFGQQLHFLSEETD